MDMAMLIAAVTTAASIGLGCGTCCSPLISIFLSTYVVSHADGVKKGLVSFAGFFIGKLSSITALCVIAAAISTKFISDDGYIGGFNLRLAAQVFMSVIGFAMLIKWVVKSKRKDSCSSCKGCREVAGSGFLTMLLAGIGYGITPCTPLIFMIGYCFTLPVYTALISGIAFGLSSAFSPILLLAAISGALSKRLSKEIPQYLNRFRLASYVLLMILPFVIHYE